MRRNESGERSWRRRTISTRVSSSASEPRLILRDGGIAYRGRSPDPSATLDGIETAARLNLAADLESFRGREIGSQRRTLPAPVHPDLPRLEVPVTRDCSHPCPRTSDIARFQRCVAESATNHAKPMIRGMSREPWGKNWTGKDQPVACRLSPVACRLSLVACRLSLVACRRREPILFSRICSALNLSICR